MLIKIEEIFDQLKKQTTRGYKLVASTRESWACRTNPENFVNWEETKILLKNVLNSYSDKLTKNKEEISKIRTTLFGGERYPYDVVGRKQLEYILEKSEPARGKANARHKFSKEVEAIYSELVPFPNLNHRRDAMLAVQNKRSNTAAAGSENVSRILTESMPIFKTYNRSCLESTIRGIRKGIY